MWSRKLFILMTCVVNYLYFLRETMDGTDASDNANAYRNVIMIQRQQQSPCTRTDVRQGKWIEKIAKNFTSDDDDGSSTMAKVPSPTQYQWIPRGYYPNPNKNGIGSNGNSNTATTSTTTTCLYQEEFNSTLFCNLMNNSVILFIGDSITFEMYQSLVHLTYGKVSWLVEHRAKFIHIPIIINVCGNNNNDNDNNNNNNNNNVTLVYRWNEELDDTGTSVSIKQMLTEQFPTMIVLNTGAHYQSDVSFRANVASTLMQIRSWQQTCRDRLNLTVTTCPFFWRTTTPGIPHCTDFTRPVNNITKMEAHVALYPTKNNWEKMKYQNDIALEMISEYEVIDGYEMGIQRPELHKSEKDCLHHSNMAVADAWNVALLHYLRASRTMEDVERVANYRYDFSRVANVHPSGKDLDWDLMNG